MSTLIQRWQTEVVSTLKYGYLFNVTIKILIFQASLYRNKIVFRVNPKLTLFQRWILSMNQRWQTDVESTWILGWPTSLHYFNIYQSWINVECLLCYTHIYIWFTFEKYVYIKKIPPHLLIYWCRNQVLHLL